MKYKAQNIKIMSSDELLSKLHEGAKLYAKYADTTLLFIFRRSRADTYGYYEVRFGKNNFMHLAGIKSKTLNAVQFYEACAKGTVTRADCSPRNDAKTMYAKVAVMEQILDLKNSKCYKSDQRIW